MFLLEKMPRCSSGELGDEGGRGGSPWPGTLVQAVGRGCGLAAFSRE